jgi:hypothetical protein
VQPHPELDLAAEQLCHDACFVARRAPAGARLDPDDSRPVAQPVRGVGDVREASSSGTSKWCSHLERTRNRFHG